MHVKKIILIFIVSLSYTDLAYTMQTQASLTNPSIDNIIKVHNYTSRNLYVFITSVATIQELYRNSKNPIYSYYSNESVVSLAELYAVLSTKNKEKYILHPHETQEFFFTNFSRLFYESDWGNKTKENYIVVRDDVEKNGLLAMAHRRDLFCTKLDIQSTIHQGRSVSIYDEIEFPNTSNYCIHFSLDLIDGPDGTLENSDFFATIGERGEVGQDHEHHLL